MSLVTDSTGNDLTYRIIGAAMDVHNEIRYGFKEEVYEKAMEVKPQAVFQKKQAMYQPGMMLEASFKKLQTWG